MTIQQKQLVRQSLPGIQEIAGPLALLFYGRLFELDPSLRPLFRQDIEIQGRKLTDILTAVVENLEQFESLAPTLRAMGQKHAGYGVRPENYETVERALTWALGRALDSGFPPELKVAWVSVIRAISDGMKAGAAELAPG
ncbi:MAG: globin domain-containing protein [Bryobacteraceae bacterium]